MSRVTKRKHVQNEVLEMDWEPPTDVQSIAKVRGSRGNNLHEVINTDGESFLVSMPRKFRKNVWIKRGDFVIVEPISEGDRVKAEIVRVLTTDHLKEFKRIGVWPWPEDKSKESEQVEDGLVPNTNRRQPLEYSEDETTTETEESERSETDNETTDDERKN